jgi:hypothetical protein
MAGSACGPHCGFCGRCSAAWEGSADGHRDCDHPLHWLDADGSCRLCHASASTIVREAAQRQHAREPR